MKKLILSASLALAVVVALGSCKHPANEGGGNDDKTTPPVVTVTLAAGGVVLDDGTWIEAADIASLDAAALSGKKVAGISAYEIDGKQYLVAPTTASNKVWAKSGTKGYTMNITAMQGNKDVETDRREQSCGAQKSGNRLRRSKLSCVLQGGAV